RKKVEYPARVGSSVGERRRCESMYHVGKFDSISDEEYRKIVAYQIIIALVGIKLNGKSTRVSVRFGRTLLMCYRRKTDEYRRSFPFCTKEISSCNFRKTGCRYKLAISTCTSCMNYSFRNPFPVESRQLFDKVNIL